MVYYLRHRYLIFLLCNHLYLNKMNSRNATFDDDHCDINIPYSKRSCYSIHHKVMFLGFAPVIIVIGVFLNSAFLFVIFRIPRIRNATNFYLCNLAVSDSVLLITSGSGTWWHTRIHPWMGVYIAQIQLYVDVWNDYPFVLLHFGILCMSGNIRKIPNDMPSHGALLTKTREYILQEQLLQVCGLFLQCFHYLRSDST